MKIAVIGAGIAGITAAHHLSKRHEVVLFDKNDYVGGHTHTVVIPSGPDEGTPVDTGFIVFNEGTYPNFVRFLDELGVQGRPSDASFGYHDAETDLQWAGHDLSTLFAQKSNLFNPRFIHMLQEILRFNRAGLKAIGDRSAVGMTLSEYCRERRHSAYFQRHYLEPLGAALWSTRPEEVADFPADAYLRFFRNHGLLSLVEYPLWKTVVGGSHAYVKAFAKQFTGRIHTASPVEAVLRTEREVIVRTGGASQVFDKAILACHADEALRLIERPTHSEQALLGPWQYTLNHVVLHTDEQVLPPLRKIWSSWNAARKKEGSDAVFATYDMNRLQGLKTRHHYLVTLNAPERIRPERVIADFWYHHPRYTLASLATQARLPELNGSRNTYFCGSYFNHGFHEDAVVSALGAVTAVERAARVAETVG